MKAVLHSLPLLSIKMELLVASEEGTKPVNYRNEEGVPCSNECVVAVDIERHSAAKIKVGKERWGEEGGREGRRERERREREGEEEREAERQRDRERQRERQRGRRKEEKDDK